MSIDTDRLGVEKYVSLTTFRKNGDPVATPVWVAQDGERLVVVTEVSSGKAKRLGHTDRVLLAPCDMRGNVRGPAVPGTAQLLDTAGTERVRQLIQHKYGIVARLFGLKEGFDQIIARVRGANRETSRVGIEIELSAPN